MQNVLYIDTWSIGNVFNHVGESLKKSLAEIGVTLYAVNIVSEDYAAELTRLLEARSYEFAFSFGGAGKASASGNQSLWEAAKLPYITLYGDSPSYYFDQHFDFTTWGVSLYAFEEHLNLRQMFATLRGFYGVAPMLPYSTILDAEIDWKLKENGKLIFLKNGNDPQALKAFWQRSLNPLVCEALMELAASMEINLDECSHAQIVKAVQQCLQAAGMHGGAEKLLLLMVAQLDDYLRRVKSALVANVLLDYPVEVHGFNWGHLNTTGRRGTLVAETDYLKSETLIRESLATIDMSPNTVTGIHDRVARAASHQTLCVTNSGQDFARSFSNYPDFSYDFNEASLRARVESMLSRRKDVIDMGITFSREFKAAYSIDKAYAQLKRLAGFVRENGRSAEIEDSPPYFMWPPTSFVKTQSHKPVYIEEIAHWGGKLTFIEQTLEAGRLQSGDSGNAKKGGLLGRFVRDR